MRIWRTAPFTAIVAVVALAMGIGFTTTMFSIVHGATRPLPFVDAQRVVAIEKLVSRAAMADAGARPFDFSHWQRATSLSVVGAYESTSMNIAGDGGEPERISGAAISANTFAMLGVSVAYGRTLLESDAAAGAPPVVVLSHRLWQRRFGSDPGVIGRSVRLTGVSHVIVGVMPPKFAFPVNESFWVPLALDPLAAPRTGARLQAFGRLLDGVTLERATVELETLTAAAYAGSAVPPAAGAIRARVMPFQEIETPREIVRALYLLVLAVSFVLLIACANVANLLIARAASRSREMALCLALGATRGRLIRGQLRETLSLAAIATIVGVGIAQAGTRLFAVSTSEILEAFWVDFRIDATVVAFAGTLAAVATVAAGLLPAFRTTRANVADMLRDGSGTTSSRLIGRVSRSMIGVQVALACGLLAMTIGFARAAVNIRTVPWPFDPKSILTFEFELLDSTVDNAPDRNRRLLALSEAINATPSVEAAGFINALPGRGTGLSAMSLDQPSRADESQASNVALVSPEFFTVTGTKPLAGRLFLWNDDERAPLVAVVNASFVARFSPDREPVGRRILLGARAFTIVGVVPDLIVADVQERRQDGVYLPMAQARPYGVRVMARGLADPTAMMPAIRSTLSRIDPDMPVNEIFTLHEAVYRDKKALDVLSTLFLFFGVGALSLTAVGLGGVVSFAVTQRTREIGIRVAIGATRADVLRLVVGQGSRQILIGLGIGLVMAVVLSRAFAAAVEQLPPADAPLLLSIVAAITLTALAAVAAPAWRATRLRVLDALRG